MKNIVFIPLIMLLCFSCEKFLEEDLSTIITVDNDIIRTEEGMSLALPGAYKPLSFTWNTGLGNTSNQAVLMGSDDLTTSKGGNKADFREFDQFNVTDLNYRLAFIWDGAYKSIQGSNLIIDNYRLATGDRATLNQIAGEAYFLRAYNYFWIARLWKHAPMMLHSQTYTEDLLSVEPATTEEIYEQILIDLDSAIALMDYQRVQPGRASKGSAMACKAEALLQMTGWPLYDTDKYEEAAAVAKELIDDRALYGLALLDNFSDLWQQESDGNSEEVFALTFLGTSENWNGNAMYGSAARPGDVGGWDDFMCELTFFNNYPDQPRKEATFTTDVLIDTNDDGNMDTIYWESFGTGRPYFKKFEGPANLWFLDKTNPLERFAEVYLIYAEAQVMATGDSTDADALDALNTIVRRAYGVALDAPSVYDHTSVTQDKVIQEKAWEFAGEFCRWFDLIRLEMVEEVTATKDPDDLQPLGEINYWLPIPGTETSVNDNLEY